MCCVRFLLLANLTEKEQKKLWKRLCEKNRKKKGDDCN